MENAAEISASDFGRFFTMMYTKAIRLMLDSDFNSVGLMLSDHEKAMMKSGTERKNHAGEFGFALKPEMAVSSVPSSRKSVKSMYAPAEYAWK